MIGKVRACDHGDTFFNGIQKSILFIHHYRDHIEACVTHHNGEQNTGYNKQGKPDGSDNKDNQTENE